jgi:glycerol uptake facilitator-like aquaporin
VDGGLVTLSLFITMLVLSFRSVGRTVRSAKMPPPSKHLAWAMGSALFAHAVTFISVSYFDQNFVMFYFVLAAIPAVAVVPYSAAQQRGQTPVPRPEALPVISSPEADWKLEMIR